MLPRHFANHFRLGGGIIKERRVIGAVSLEEVTDVQISGLFDEVGVDLIINPGREAVSGVPLEHSLQIRR